MHFGVCPLGKLWMCFLQHPLVAPIYAKADSSPCLSRDAERRSLDQPFGKGSHCFLLDRQDRRAYLSPRDQTMVLFGLTKPDKSELGRDLSRDVAKRTAIPSQEQEPTPDAASQETRVLDCRSAAGLIQLWKAFASLSFKNRETSITDSYLLALARMHEGQLALLINDWLRTQ
jgi:hypothetical protein